MNKKKAQWLSLAVHTNGVYVQFCTMYMKSCGILYPQDIESARGAGYRLDAGSELGVGFQINGFLVFMLNK